jgi:hypothetical protein
MEVSDTTVKLFAASEPNFTALAPVNPVPVTVTVVFPVVGPDAGEIDVTAGPDGVVAAEPPANGTTIAVPTSNRSAGIARKNFTVPRCPSIDR